MLPQPGVWAASGLLAYYVLDYDLRTARRACYHLRETFTQPIDGVRTYTGWIYVSTYGTFGRSLGRVTGCFPHYVP
jgi:hypothetical protein